MGEPGPFREHLRSRIESGDDRKEDRHRNQAASFRQCSIRMRSEAIGSRPRQKAVRAYPAGHRAWNAGERGRAPSIEGSPEPAGKAVLRYAVSLRDGPVRHLVSVGGRIRRGQSPAPFRLQARAPFRSAPGTLSIPGRKSVESRRAGRGLAPGCAGRRLGPRASRKLR
jgi:hypothetical protein